jgi:hypothetical protein
MVVVALADVRLPDESIAYWAVPVPPPHADKSRTTLALAIHDAGRMNFRRIDTLNMKLSPSQFLIHRKVDQSQVLVSEHCLRRRVPFGNQISKNNLYASITIVDQYTKTSL